MSLRKSSATAAKEVWYRVHSSTMVHFGVVTVALSVPGQQLALVVRR